MSLLSDIFYGNFSDEWIPLTKKRKKGNNNIEECEKRVREQMIDPKIARELLLKLELAYGNSESIWGEECFEFGFFFGTHLMMEIFQQDMV